MLTRLTPVGGSRSLPLASESEKFFQVRNLLRALLHLAIPTVLSPPRTPTAFTGAYFANLDPFATSNPFQLILMRLQPLG